MGGEGWAVDGQILLYQRPSGKAKSSDGFKNLLPAGVTIVNRVIQGIGIGVLGLGVGETASERVAGEEAGGGGGIVTSAKVDKTGFGVVRLNL